MSDEDNSNWNYGRHILPGVWTIPLLWFAFWGCVDDGCQGALNAQSVAVHQAVEAGGWLESADE